MSCYTDTETTSDSRSGTLLILEFVLLDLPGRCPREFRHDGDLAGVLVGRGPVETVLLDGLAGEVGVGRERRTA